jgi:diguanylate cyclase (GGDEF)-like protein
MRLIRSAPGWAIATVGLLLALLIGTTIVALLATREEKSRLESLEATSLYASALETARAEFLAANGDMAAVAATGDQTLLLTYENDVGLARKHLGQAREIALSEGRQTDVVFVDDLIRRVDSYNQAIRDALTLFLAGDEEASTRNQNELSVTATRLAEDLRVAVEREQALVSAERASAAETSDRSFLTQAILGAFALAAATGAGGTLIVKARQLTQNIEKRKRAEEKIKHLAYHDALTGLPNRNLLENRLATALTQAHRKSHMLALLYLDLDRFKRVNDGVGRAFGDQVLQRVAERLTSIVRQAGTIARVGGDEFAVLLPEISRAEDAAQVAERILEGLRPPLVLGGSQVHPTTSMGIAFYPNDAEEPDTLLRNADIAMYNAKEQGRDNYQLYSLGMRALNPDPLTLESDLRCALERDQFVVYYQPQVCVADSQIVGVEALVRWQHPDRGLMLPTEFIPVAEESGLIVPLGEWVLRTACAQASAWHEAGLSPIRVAVNLSARQFQQRDLVEVVGRVLKDTGLDPRFLQLEITESVAMHDIDFTSRVLVNLKDMGIQIAIDDFGTGHSSLNYLRRLPIDDVKIDQSFVRDVITDPNDAAIVGSIVAMTHELNLKLVAEGVETEEQLDFLKDRRCDVVQGFLFSKPMPADAVEQIIARGTDLQAMASGHKPV